MALRLRPPGPACLNLPAGFAALPTAPRRSSLQILDKRCPSAKCCWSDCLCNYICELVRRGSGGSACGARGILSVTSHQFCNCRNSAWTASNRRKSCEPVDALDLGTRCVPSVIVHQQALRSFTCLYVFPGLFSHTLFRNPWVAPRRPVYAAHCMRPRIRVSATHGSRRRVMRK
jgi:hypothetical protein